MTDVSHQNASEHADAILRQLAVRAIGVSGADIERLIREARQKARRERRPLSFGDVEAAIGGTKAQLPASHLWQRAVHEAGHVVARVRLGIGNIVAVTINGPGGGSYVQSEVAPHELQTEEQLVSMLVILLAGRAAEQEITGSAVAGSGGSSISDLARATDLAFDIETRLGFGGRWPLLYRPDRDAWNKDAVVMEGVNRRLECAYQQACRLVKQERTTILSFSEVLMKTGTLEGKSLVSAIASLAREAC